MGLIFWLLIGLAAGAIAKMLTPQQESGGWVSSMGIGLVGSIVGKVLGGILGINNLLGNNLISDLAIAVGGAFLVLFIYHRFLADKLKLPL